MRYFKSRTLNYKEWKGITYPGGDASGGQVVVTWTSAARPAGPFHAAARMQGGIQLALEHTQRDLYPSAAVPNPFRFATHGRAMNLRGFRRKMMN